MPKSSARPNAYQSSRYHITAPSHRSPYYHNPRRIHDGPYPSVDAIIDRVDKKSSMFWFDRHPELHDDDFLFASASMTAHRQLEREGRGMGRDHHLTRLIDIGLQDTFQGDTPGSGLANKTSPEARRSSAMAAQLLFRIEGTDQKVGFISTAFWLRADAINRSRRCPR
jgi:hypothetical protein